MQAWLNDRRPRLAGLAGLLALALGLLVAAGGAGASQTPSAVAQRLDDALLSAMREADSLGYQGRYDRLAPVLEDAFDFSFMARVSVGRYWRRMNPEERARLVDTFGRLSIATFAARFDGYSGESFQIAGEQEQPRGAILVLNRLIRSNGEAVPLNYLMRRNDGRWSIVDVFLDAKFSELAIKRAEYTSVLKRDGLPKLIESMEEKIARFGAVN